MTPTQTKAKAKAKELLSYYEGSCLHDSFGRTQGVYSDNFKSIAKVFSNKVCDENIQTLEDIKGLSKMGKLKFWRFVKGFVNE